MLEQITPVVEAPKAEKPRPKPADRGPRTIGTNVGQVYREALEAQQAAKAERNARAVRRIKVAA